MARTTLVGVFTGLVVAGGITPTSASERLVLEDTVVASDKLEQARDQLPASLSVIDARTLQSTPVD